MVQQKQALNYIVCTKIIPKKLTGYIMPISYNIHVQLLKLMLGYYVPSCACQWHNYVTIPV